MPSGKVKWFNNAKGFGFIVEDGETEDLFAHFSSIQMEGYKTLKAGQSVQFDKLQSGKGIHAVNITSVEATQNSNKSPEIAKQSQIPELTPQNTASEPCSMKHNRETALA